MFFVWIFASIGVVFVVFKIFNSQNSVPTAVLSGEDRLNHPINQSLGSIAYNQKLSLINLLLSVGTCDLPKGNSSKELKYLNDIIGILGVRADECKRYLKSYGDDQTFSDLKQLSLEEKSVVICMVWDMVISDGSINQTEAETIAGIFPKMDISDNFVKETLTRTSAFINYIKQ